MKYKCIPNLCYNEDPSCFCTPCVLEVPDGTPAPLTCPYNEEDNYCSWEKIEDGTKRSVKEMTDESDPNY